MTTINSILSVLIFLQIAAGLAFAGAVTSIFLGGGANSIPGGGGVGGGNSRKEMTVFVFILGGIVAPILAVVAAGLYLVMDYSLTTPILGLIQSAILVAGYRAFRKTSS